VPELSQKLVFFTTRRVELERRFATMKATLAPADGLDEPWQTLRFVYRREDR
jgi:hypothetical protein